MMNDFVTFKIDNVSVRANKGQTILNAADEAGIYIPRLCFMKNLLPGGNCRICTVLVNGRPQSACTHPAGEAMVVENNTTELTNWRKSIVEMMFVEGNHFCMFCEKSGNCELQAMGYRLGIATPRHPFQFPIHHVDASHPDVMMDRNRCIYCGRCVRASNEWDHKNVFGFVGRGSHTRLAVNAQARLKETDLQLVDQAVSSCPVGCIIKKRVGFKVPIGQRIYDKKPIGSEIEEKAPQGR